MDADELAREKAAAYHALGRYIAGFSHLVATMREKMERRLIRPGDPMALIQTVFHDAPAASIGNAFFGICKTLGEIEPGTDDIAVWTWLYEKVVQKTVPERNKIAHADWHIGSFRLGREGTVPRYVRTTARTGEGAVHTEISTVDLDLKAVEVLNLAGTIDEFGDICFKNHLLYKQHPSLRVSDIFLVKGRGDNRRVMREGLLKDAELHPGHPFASIYAMRPG